MVDAAFTYGGEALGYVAIAVWAWLGATALPTFGTVVARYEDDAGLGARFTSERRGERPRWVGQAAAGLTAVAIVFQSIGYAIPD